MSQIISIYCQVLLALSISSIAFGNWFSKESGLEATQKMCFNSVNWQAVGCELKRETEYRLTYLRDPFTKKNNSSDLSSVDGKQKRDILISTMQTIISDKNLNQCQSLALVKCVTSRYIQFDDNLPAYFEEALYDTYLKERGNCRQYSSIFYDLSKAIGLDVEVVSGSHVNNSLHAFNIVKLGQAWYYLEPQYSDPILFRIKSRKYLSNLKSNDATPLFVFLNLEDSKTLRPSDYMDATILPIE